MHASFPEGQVTSCCSIGARLAELDKLETAAALAEKQAVITSWLDAGPQSARVFWEHVDHAKGLAVGKWKFVADPQLVEQHLLDDTRFSVKEYDRRMRATSGRFFLGMDPPEHDRDAAMGVIIPSWNTFRASATKNAQEIEAVRNRAEQACRAALAGTAQLTQLARLTNPKALCRPQVAAIFGPVLDACSAWSFGLSGPSSTSLALWAKELTWYHFRVYADEAADRSCAREASGQYRAHVLAQIGALDDELHEKVSDEERARRDKLRTVVARLRQLHAAGSDEAIASALLNILTGSITATLKAFSEGLALYAAVRRDAARGTIVWPEQAQPLASDFPHYDSVIASTLAAVRRGSLDSVYRTYVAKDPTVSDRSSIELNENDLVVLWLGGTLPANPDNVFGIGVHKCPGMDMGKAIMDGALRALCQLKDADSPRIERDGDSLYFVFDNPDALVKLATQQQT
jgi:hypothetical protein